MIAFFTVIALQLLGDDSISLDELRAANSPTSVVELNNGYRGKFTNTFTEFEQSRDCKPETFEFSHALILRSRKSGNLIRQIAVATGADDTGDAKYFGPTSRLLESIPSFDELKKLQNIDDYVDVFGESIGFTDAVGSTIGGKTTWNSSQGWSGFETKDNGEIRVVSVFLYTTNTGSGWKIKHRTIREGIFRSTGKKPVWNRK